MSTAARQTDPRREHLRQQAIKRRQAVLDRLSGTRTVLVGGAVVASCVLAMYIDANAHTRPNTAAGSGSNLGSTGSDYGNYGSNSYGQSSNYGGGSSNYGGSSSSQNSFGGGSPPSSSSGGGSVISGGS